MEKDQQKNPETVKAEGAEAAQAQTAAEETAEQTKAAEAAQADTKDEKAAEPDPRDEKSPSRNSRSLTCRTGSCGSRQILTTSGNGTTKNGNVWAGM